MSHRESCILWVSHTLHYRVGREQERERGVGRGGEEWEGGGETDSETEKERGEERQTDRHTDGRTDRQTGR